MDTTQTADLVEHHLTQMSAISVRDEPSAHQALAHAMAAVGGINQGLSLDADVTSIAGGAVDEIIKKLQDWIKRLVDKLTEIVKEIAGGATFSISVGTGVSVTVNFGPFK